MNAPQQSLEDRIREWLTKQGYPLEMESARCFQRAGARVVQSDYFADPVTNESREIDVVATWQDRVEQILLQFTVVAECKTSRDKPWLLLTSSEARLAAPARIAQRAGSTFAQLALCEFADNTALQRLPIFTVPTAPAYSLRQALGANVDACYAAISGVAAAVASLGALPDSQETQQGRIDILEVLFPVVVTDARLFEAELQEGGELSLVETRAGVLLWRNPVVQIPHTIIHVVSSPALNEFAQQAAQSAEEFFELCAGDLKPMLLKAHEKRLHARVRGVK